MIHAANNTGALEAVRARTTLIQAVRTLLKGSGLDIRELGSQLVVSRPGHPDHGRVYITYANGEVSLRRCTWEYLGYLDGYGSNDPEGEPSLSADKILDALTGQNGDSP